MLQSALQSVLLGKQRGPYIITAWPLLQTSGDDLTGSSKTFEVSEAKRQ